jgi:hypothetical protein
MSAFYLFAHGPTHQGQSSMRHPCWLLPPRAAPLRRLTQLSAPTPPPYLIPEAGASSSPPPPLPFSPTDDELGCKDASRVPTLSRSFTPARGRSQPPPRLLFLSSHRWLRPSANAIQAAPSMPCHCRGFGVARPGTPPSPRRTPPSPGGRFLVELRTRRATVPRRVGLRAVAAGPPPRYPVEPSPCRLVSVVSRVVESNT